MENYQNRIQRHRLFSLLSICCFSLVQCVCVCVCVCECHSHSSSFHPYSIVCLIICFALYTMAIDVLFALVFRLSPASFCRTHIRIWTTERRNFFFCFASLLFNFLLAIPFASARVVSVFVRVGACVSYFPYFQAWYVFLLRAVLYTFN